MAKIARIDAGRRHGPRPTNALARRSLRLQRRVHATTCPIVWLCGIAGSGKTWLMESLKPSLIARGCQLLDDPAPAVLEGWLEDVANHNPARRLQLLLASRSSADLAAVLLKSRAYGLVDTLTESALFVRADDAAADETPLLTLTGGWPWLCGAALSGRADSARALLPEFLEREVLPAFSEEARAALCATLSLPSSPRPPASLLADCVLLRPGSEGGGIRGDWVRTALLSLRGSAPLKAAGVRDRLMRLYATLDDPTPAIEAQLGLGDHRSAFELFRQCGGAYFGYRHGYHVLARVLDLFGPALTERSEELYLARLWMLLKTGKCREALLRLEARHPGLPVDMRRLRLSHRPELLLLRADLSIDLDGMPPLEVIASWGRLQEFMEPGDDLSRGLLYNSMAIGYLQADAMVEARQLAEEALAAYERARMPYLVHFMHVHLAEIALRQSRLGEAAAHVGCAEERLRESGHAFKSEYAIIDSLKSRLAFEQGRFDDCGAEIQPLLEALTGGDSWSDLIPRLAAQSALAALWRSGLKAALEQLDRCALAQSRRHGVTASRRLQLVRIRVLQAARRHPEAGMLLEEFDLASEVRPSSALELEIGLVHLRHALERECTMTERSRLSDSLAQHPALEARHRVTLALLTAAARLRDGAGALARRHLRIALREAESHGLVAPLIEDGEYLERLLPGFISAPGPGNGRLADFAVSVLKIMGNLSSTPLRSKALAGLSRQEHRVLSYAIDGYPNKHIARAMNVSESTVKFHLRSLFRKLRVNSRAALAEAARARGIVT